MAADSDFPARNHKTIWWFATALLFLMASLFFFCNAFEQRYPVLRAVRAFAEAAMVGGLADWFAVTALFRRPLGLPIPHTAIIPENKSRIGKSLGVFIHRNFLSEEVIESEVINLSGILTRWLEDAENRKVVIEKLRFIIPQLLETLEEDEIRVFFDKQAEDILKDLDLASLSAKILRLLTVDEMHELVLDEVVLQSRNFFRENHEWFRNELLEASPWFIPDFVDRRIFQAIVDKTESTFTAALGDRKHELRLRVHTAVENFIDKLERSPSVKAQAEDLKLALISSSVVRDYVGTLRNGILENIRNDLQNPDSKLSEIFEKVLSGFSKTVRESEDLQQRLNKTVRRLITTLVGDDGEYLVQRIARTVESWDTETLVEKLEEQVGHDLQYIRINGTVVGGTVGLLLFFLQQGLS